MGHDRPSEPLSTVTDKLRHLAQEWGNLNDADLLAKVIGMYAKMQERRSALVREINPSHRPTPDPQTFLFAAALGFAGVSDADAGSMCVDALRMKECRPDHVPLRALLEATASLSTGKLLEIVDVAVDMRRASSSAVRRRLRSGVKRPREDALGGVSDFLDSVHRASIELHARKLPCGDLLRSGGAETRTSLTDDETRLCDAIARALVVGAMRPFQDSIKCHACRRLDAPPGTHGNLSGGQRFWREHGPVIQRECVN